jgi:hypothetical protein
MYRILKNASKSEKHTFINFAFSRFAPSEALREDLSPISDKEKHQYSER